MTVLRCTGSARATKRWRWNLTLQAWVKTKYEAGKWFTAAAVHFADLREMVAVLEQVRRDPLALIVRGALAPDTAADVAANPGRLIRRLKRPRGTYAATLVEAARRWFMADIDGWPLPPWADLVDDPDTVIDHAIHELLPPAFHNATCWWQLSSSAGFAAGVLKVHLFFWLSEPASNDCIRAVVKQCAPGIDARLFCPVQEHFIADPIIEGAHDPLPRRTGWRIGLEDEVVLPELPPRPTGGGATRAGYTGQAGGLEVLGDGAGLEGFHAPLRTATMRYAAGCTRGSQPRDDAAFIAALQAAVRAAPQRPDRDVESVYTQDYYLQQLIVGAFDRVSSGEPDHPQSIQPQYQPQHAASVEDARNTLRALIANFLARAADWLALPEHSRPPAEHAGIIVGVGVGKSHAARVAVADFIDAVRNSRSEVCVLWLVPTHKLGSEALLAMEQLGLIVAVLRGREAQLPGSDDETKTMCSNLAAVEDALAIHADVEKDVCGSGKPGEPSCSHYHQCPYQAQKNAAAYADVLIVAHQSLFHHLPAVVTKRAALVIVDESWWQAGLMSCRDIRLAGFAEEPILHPVLRDKSKKVDASATADLHAWAVKAQGALESGADGALASKQALINSGLSAMDCNEAVKLEWRRKVDGVLVPGMTPAQRKKALAKAEGNTAIPRRAAVWRALEALLKGTDTHTGRLELGTKGAPSGGGRVVLLHSRAEVSEKLAAKPMLLLDATMPVDLVRQFLPRINILANVQPPATHQTVHQVVGGWGKTSISPSKKATDEENRHREYRVAELADFCRLNSGGNALVVTYQDIEPMFDAKPDIRTGHFNNILGLDKYGDVRSLFVIGRPLPTAPDLLAMARALTGESIQPEPGHVETRGVLMSDGTGRPLNVRVYADQTLEMLRAAITDAEVVQCIGRGRGVNRTATSPIDVFVMADVILPLPVNRLVRWEDIRLNVVMRMLGRHGALFSPVDAHRAYPDLFPSPDAARMALGRTTTEQTPMNICTIGECSVVVRYQPTGQRLKPRTARVLPRHLAGFQTWIEGVVGPLDHYDVMTRPPPDA